MKHDSLTDRVNQPSNWESRTTKF